MRQFALVALVVGFSSPAFAQSPITSQSVVTSPPPLARSIDLSGPRFGFTLLSQGVVDAIKERGHTVGPMISQFGWQLERQFYTPRSGPSAVFEAIGLVGGLEQGVPIPSLSLMTGLRGRSGVEFGVGPNVTPAGFGLVIAAGMNYRTGALNVPVNVAVVPSKGGVRVTVLTGFNMRLSR